MMNQRMAAALAAAVLGLCACSEQGGALAHNASASESVTEIATERSRVSQNSWSLSFQKGSATAVSRTERTVKNQGEEMLSGVTELQLSGGRAPLFLVEKVQIAASGKLVRAEASLFKGSQKGDLMRTITLDPKVGRVITVDQKGERSFAVATDAPWMYRQLFSDIAREASGLTATSAWVGYRAAQVGGRIRDIDLSTRSSELTVAEQVVFDDGPLSLVVMGDEVAEVDKVSVRTIQWKTFANAFDLYRLSTSTVGVCGEGPC